VTYHYDEVIEANSLSDFESKLDRHLRYTEDILQSSPYSRQFCCSLAVLDSRAGHTVYVLSPFIFVLCHWLTLPWEVLSIYWCCPSRSCVVFLACVHLS